MLYASILILGLLATSNSQCLWGPESEDGDWLSDYLNVGSGVYDRSGGQQYVVFDFSKLSADAIRGEYFLPYLIDDEDGDSYCHNQGFTSGQTLAFECSTDGTTIYAREYLSSDCSSGMFREYWWEQGYTPYLMYDNVTATTSSDCDSHAACANYTRQAVTVGSGSRYDFSCNGTRRYAAARLCVLSDECDGTACSEVYAAVGADCIQTPNATTDNLLVSCNSKKKEAYLTTFFDSTQYMSGDPWNTYTVDHRCDDNSDVYTSSFACNNFAATEDCALLFEAAGNKVYGQYLDCTETLKTVKSKSSSLSVSMSLLFIVAVAAFFN